MFKSIFHGFSWTHRLICRLLTCAFRTLSCWSHVFPSSSSSSSSSCAAPRWLGSDGASHVLSGWLHCCWWCPRPWWPLGNRWGWGWENQENLLKIYWKHPKHIETMDFDPQMIFGSSDFRTGLSGAWKELSSSMNWFFSGFGRSLGYDLCYPLPSWGEKTTEQLPPYLRGI